MVQSKEERRAKKKEYLKEYYSRPEIKAKAKEKRDRPEIKAKTKERNRKYYQRPENMAKAKEIRDRPENRAKARDEYYKIRLKILQYYSKRLSNSNIPCCHCCGLNSHLDFLSLDHIAGKKEMDSEYELKKLGYSSKLSSAMLFKFLIDNNCPDGFQILCTNCNSAKGYPRNNNECPMKNKPH